MRPCLFDDVLQAAKVADALDQIDFFMSLGLVSDVPHLTYDRHQFLAMAMGTKKPLIITCMDRNAYPIGMRWPVSSWGEKKGFRLTPIRIICGAQLPPHPFFPMFSIHATF